MGILDAGLMILVEVEAGSVLEVGVDEGTLVDNVRARAAQHPSMLGWAWLGRC